MKRETRLTILSAILAVTFLIVMLCACDEKAAVDTATETTTTTTQATTTTTTTMTVALTTAAQNDDFEIPPYDGRASVPINGNVPVFDESRKTTESFEEYGEKDKHGRCTVAFANLSTDTQPAADEVRGDISAIHPSGWRSGQGWERCHLIGWALSGENDNPRNLVTGTHYMNVDGMLPYENKVNWYISETGNHVLYEVTPIYKGKNPICEGVHMQAESVEDDGRGVSFNVFCFNVSPGHDIDYKTGEITVVDQDVVSRNAFERGYVLNTNSMKFHYPSCSSVAKIAEHNKQVVTTSREELMKQGYEPCGSCEP